MNDIERLAHAVTELANHVAAAVRLSNEFTGILRDGDRDDIDAATRRVILRAAKTGHEEFRDSHFRGLVDSLNAVVAMADAMYQAEPAVPEGPDVQTSVPPAEDNAPIARLADIQEASDATPAP